MNQKQYNQHWKRLLLLVLCVVQCMLLVSPAATALADALNERDYLIATMPASEGAELGAASWLVALSEDLAYAGIASQATMIATEGISLIGDQKSTVINSSVCEGYLHSERPTYPLLALSCAWQALDTATQDLMFYVELPESSSEIRINSLACNSWSFWVSPKGMQYQYLSVDDDAWANGQITADDSKTLALPEGFKGYVRLKVDTAENAAAFPSASLTIQDMTFLLDRFGGDYGAVKISGVWFVSKEDYTKIKIGEGEVLEMTNPPVRDYLIASMPASEGAELGAPSWLVSLSEDLAYAGIASQATIVAGEGISLIGDQKAAVINSPVKEGYAHAGGATYPLFSLQYAWQTLDTAMQDVMFYVELPESGSEMRINSITCNSWSFWVDPAGMDYQYLAKDGSAWVNGEISTDGNKSLDLPEGFKGYVRLKVNTAANAAQFPAAVLTVQEMTFMCDHFGGDYGAVKLSGLWFVSKEDLVKIQVGEGEVVAMTVESATEPDTEPTEPTEPEETTEPTEPTEPEEPTEPADRDYLIGAMPAQENAEIGAASSLTVISEDPAWAGIASQATIKAAEGITIIGDQKSTWIDSPIREGYFSSAGATYPLLEVNCAWQQMDTATQDLMLYIELPMASSEIRFWAITCNGWTFWVSPNGMEYQYLSIDADKWENGKISTDGNKTISLPKGFKGYIRLKVDTAENAAQFPDAVLQVQNFSFRADVFGGGYGPVKLGGVWFVSKEDYCHISVDGAAKKVMTNYWTDNEADISQFNELMGQLNQKDLSAAPIVDRLQNLYESMSEEYRAKVTQEELAKIQEYTAAVDAYRPAFQGVSLKKPGSLQQSMKAGWNVDEALAEECGYKVVSCGMAMLFSRKYDGSSIIDENLADAVLVEGKVTGGVCSAAMDIDKVDYQEDLLIRCYVIYENIQTGDQFAVWCGSYTDQSGQTNPYLQCSLFEVANYFGVPLYAK